MKQREFLFKFTGMLLAALFVFGLLASPHVAAAQEEEDEVRESNPQSTASKTLYEVIESEPTLETFETLVDAVGLSDNLSEDGPFTVFAPTNEAWTTFNLMAKFDAEATLTETMLYHILNGSYASADLAGHWALPTLAGDYIFVNGMTADLSTNPAFLTANGQSSATAEITLNETARLIVTDIQTANGVLHIIDTVVALPEGNSVFASDLGSPNLTMVDVLAADGRFDTFLSLAEMAGLMDELETTTGLKTLFVPTDEAFEAVPDEMMAAWLADPATALDIILSYHLVHDRLSINQIATDKYLPTLEGRALVVTTDEDLQVYINGRPVQEFNLLASNGIIHVMNEVVLP